MQNKNKLPRWRTKGVKATPNAEFGKLIETVLYIAENFFVLPIARQENFYVFWKTILKITTIMKKSFVLITSVLATVLFANSSIAQNIDEELVIVNRWYNPSAKNYVTLAEGEYQEGQILNWGWKNKTSIFYAYRNPGEGRVAVNSWFNPTTQDYASIAEDEYTDDQMIKMGYRDKKHQFYALTRRGGNTLAVYRWRIDKTNDWVTIADDGNTDAYLKKGYRHKTFQYFGIARNIDAPIYNQL